ncbi:MAG: phosphoenolpyruvate--protein phosphotransferase, partial [Rhodocyclaceae bacterium]|nr:phosphoenolpyruvate--protein phosphotransferase [Rhodocyclaceae bacterium]
AHGKLRIMLPLVSGLPEVRAAREILDEAKAELEARGADFDRAIPLGCMVETPASVVIVDLLAREADFLSIGTNDLIQYTLAIDRTDEAVAHLYDPLHPAVLKLVGSTIQTGVRFGLPVSVCGEMAGDPAYTRLLLGIGLRQFSMHPAQILEVKQEVLRADVGEIAAKAQRLLKMDEPTRVREAFERL